MQNVIALYAELTENLPCCQLLHTAFVHWPDVSYCNFKQIIIKCDTQKMLKMPICDSSRNLSRVTSESGNVLQ